MLGGGGGGKKNEPPLTVAKTERTAVCIWRWGKKDEQLLVAVADRKGREGAAAANSESGRASRGTGNPEAALGAPPSYSGASRSSLASACLALDSPMMAA